MSFFRFNEGDIINTKLVTYPSFVVELNGDQVTGSVYLERQYLEDGLNERTFQGFSEKDGGLTEKKSPFTASIDLITAISSSTNKQLFETVKHLYDYYSLVNTVYTASFNNLTVTTYRVATIPTVYYDFSILTGSFTASDKDAAGNDRNIYDNGRGGLHSGSLSGTIVGNLFYSEGIAVFKKSDLTDFGSISSENFKWKISLKGTHKIPVTLYRCRAPAGQLNASTNETFYQTPASGDYKNQKQIVVSGSTYITEIGLFNEDYELVATAKLAQAIRKNENDDLVFKIGIDW